MRPPPIYSPHSMRGTGITNCLLNGGSIEVAKDIADHPDARTTRLYNRRTDHVNQGEILLIRFYCNIFLLVTDTLYPLHP